MKIKLAFAKGLRQLRYAKSMSQEDFSNVSGRTYISMLERGERNPTLEKIEDLAKALRVHPLALICLTYVYAGGYRDLETMFDRVRSDLKGLVS